MKKAKVLFLCTGNSARSQMAEAFLRKYGGDNFEAHSAGLTPQAINPLTIKVMEEIGLSLEEHHSKHINEYLGKMNFDYLITVCDGAKEQCPILSEGVKKKLHWSFEDPVKSQGPEMEKLEKFREVRDQLRKRIKKWLQEQRKNPEQ